MKANGPLPVQVVSREPWEARRLALHTVLQARWQAAQLGPSSAGISPLGQQRHSRISRTEAAAENPNRNLSNPFPSISQARCESRAGHSPSPVSGRMIHLGNSVVKGRPLLLRVRGDHVHGPFLIQRCHEDLFRTLVPLAL